VTPTWYDLLGVEETADAEQIRAAWRRAIADLDPTERRFATLNEAAAVLLDPARRSAYDAELAASRLAEPEPEPEPEVAPEGEPEVEAVSVQTQAQAEPEAPEPTHAEPDEEPADMKTRSAGRPYLVPGWTLATLGVVTAAAVILAVVLGSRAGADKVVQSEVQLSSGSTVTQIEEPALAAQAAAKEAIVPVISYDYRHLDEDQKKAEGFLTADYRKVYDKNFDALVKGQNNAVKTQTVVTTKVVGSAIVRASGDRVQVLLFIDQPASNKVNPTPQVFANEVAATMQKVGDRWLIDDLTTTKIAE
jgi:Mce-associated membrane protein